MRGLFVNLILMVIAGIVAVVLVNGFDAWYEDKERRRAAKRARKEARYE